MSMQPTPFRVTVLAALVLAGCGQTPDRPVAPMAGEAVDSATVMIYFEGLVGLLDEDDGNVTAVLATAPPNFSVKHGGGTCDVPTHLPRLTIVDPTKDQPLRLGLSEMEVRFDFVGNDAGVTWKQPVATSAEWPTSPEAASSMAWAFKFASVNLPKKPTAEQLKLSSGFLTTKIHLGAGLLQTAHLAEWPRPKGAATGLASIAVGRYGHGQLESRAMAEVFALQVQVPTGEQQLTIIATDGDGFERHNVPVDVGPEGVALVFANLPRWVWDEKDTPECQARDGDGEESRGLHLAAFAGMTRSRGNAGDRPYAYVSQGAYSFDGLERSFQSPLSSDYLAVRAKAIPTSNRAGFIFAPVICPGGRWGD